MLVSRSKFYQAVTGATTANRSITEAALKRWGVPFEAPNGTKGDAVDIVHLETAKKVWEAERAAREARKEVKAPRKARVDPDALAANTDALKDVQAALLLVAEEMGKLTAILSERRKA